MKHRYTLAVVLATLGSVAGTPSIAREASEAPRREDRQADRREDRHSDRATETADDHGRHGGGRDDSAADRSGRSGREDQAGRGRGG